MLSGFNLTIEPGTKVALVGASGQGKSTVIALLQRFYDVQGGAVLVGDTSLKDVDLKWWRERVAVVSQEPALLLGSVMENIALGMPGSTYLEVKAAAEAANAHEFIIKLPYGYDTFVGEGGALLSGGQKQRIAIAQALLRNPEVLMLDEATSALDSQNESEVQAALDKVMYGRTVRAVRAACCACCVLRVLRVLRAACCVLRAYTCTVTPVLFFYPKPKPTGDCCSAQAVHHQER